MMMNSDNESNPEFIEENNTVDETAPQTLNNLDTNDIPIVAATESVTSENYDAAYVACLNDDIVTTPSVVPVDNRPRTEGKYHD